ESLEPAYPGWLAHESPMSFSPEFRPAAGARRFQQGSPAVEPVYSAKAGLTIALEATVAAIRAHQLKLTGRMIERAEHWGLRVRTPRDPSSRGAVVCLDITDAAAIVATLEEQGIDADYRPAVGLRLAPHYCYREDECV